MKCSFGHRKQANLSESIHQQLNMYAIAASAAGVGLLALAQPAEGKIVYTPTYQFVPPYCQFCSLDLDLNHDHIADFMFSHWSTMLVQGINVCAAASYCSEARGPNQILQVGDPGGGWAAALRAGEQISARKPFGPDLGMAFTVRQDSHCPSVGTNYAVCSLGPWKNVKGRYLGLKFVIQGKIHYGWARLNVGKGARPAVLTGFAYETIPGKAIIAGKTKGTDHLLTTSPTANPDDPGPGASLTNPIPDNLQPASLGMLALGSPGRSVRRRKEPALAGK
jgi:hypothetical protein